MVIAPICAALALGAASAGTLEAGVARVDITPPLDMKASLGGFGDRMSKPATGVHDSVWAKALVLRIDGRRFALVTADILGFPPGFKEAVAGKLVNDGWKADDIMLLPSHSHSSLDITEIDPRNDLNSPQLGIYRPAVFEWTRDRIASAIAEAAKSPIPVKIGWAQTTLPGRIRNRRAGNTLTNNALTVIRIDAADGKPLAALVNWTAHPTILGSDNMMFSGDWPGQMQRALEALIGRDAVAMYFNGAEGDQTTIRPAGGSGFEVAELYGLDIGANAWRVWQHIRPKAGIDAAWHEEPIVLPERRWSADVMKTGGEEYGITPENAAKTLDRLAPASAHSISLRLGDLVIVGVPGEVACGLGMEVERRAAKAAGVRCAVVGGIADEWIGYVLSPEEYRKGSYEASMSLYGDALGPAIVDGAVRCAAACRAEGGR